MGVQYCQITKPCLCGKGQIWVTIVKKIKIILPSDKCGDWRINQQPPVLVLLKILDLLEIVREPRGSLCTRRRFPLRQPVLAGIFFWGGRGRGEGGWFLYIICLNFQVSKAPVIAAKKIPLKVLNHRFESWNLHMLDRWLNICLDYFTRRPVKHEWLVR